MRIAWTIKDFLEKENIDGFELFVCKKDVFELLKEEAKKAGHRIDLAHNM